MIHILIVFSVKVKISMFISIFSKNSSYRLTKPLEYRKLFLYK
ncbi:hypothetical protein HMPREF1348_01147 [Enterococcus faecium 505]|uniref:Uncharacterized protein n=1 Tax=Enterococcus faecium 505 TaxID=1134806 RepID=J7CVS8_ENTFC|nr:hypothetical protein HMPREF1348_01147 [Enterococcus faecium 505]